MRNIVLIRQDIAADEVNITLGEVVIGRGPLLSCTDKRVSRNHGLVKLSDNGDIILIATHTNPFFYTKAEESVVQLNKDNSVILHNGDEFALLPDSYRFRVVIPQGTFTEDKHNGHNENDQRKDIPIIIKKEHFHQETIAEDNQNECKENDETKDVSREKEEQRIDKDKERVMRDLDIENMNSSTNQCETSCDEKRNLPSWMTALEKDDESDTKTSCSSRTVNSRKRKTAKCDTAVNKRGKRNSKNNTSDKHADGDIYSDNKTENKEDSENVKCHEMSDDDDDDSRDNADNCTSAQKVNVDLECDNPRNDDQTVNTVGTSAAAVDDQGTTSKQTRQKCMYGAKCYRRNHQHRTDFSHPGDSDYDDKDLPECPYGVTCYRKNKQHRLDFKHTQRPRKAKQQQTNLMGAPLHITINIMQNEHRDSDEEDDYDYDDPFLNDASSDDYQPTDSETEYSGMSSGEEDDDTRRMIKEAKKFTKKKK